MKELNDKLKYIPPVITPMEVRGETPLLGTSATNPAMDDTEEDCVKGVVTGGSSTETGASDDPWKTDSWDTDW